MVHEVEILSSRRQLRDQIEDGWKAIHAANKKTTIFQMGGRLARLIEDEQGVQAKPMNEVAAYGHLARIANWVKIGAQGPVDTKPVREVAQDMLVNIDPGLPILEGVVFTPVFDREGRLVIEHGYHAASHLWFHRLPGVDFGEVPRNPTAIELKAALGLLLNDLLVDFPFTADSDRAHALAALLLPLVRRMVRGCTPIHLFESPTPGSGKGLLKDCVSIVALGSLAPVVTITRDEDEARKKITSILSRGQPLVVIDNVRGALDSSQLAAVITTEIWSDRLLSLNLMVDLPNRATWIVTANNPSLSLENARRCVRVRIDPKTDRPWQRTGFRHEELREWVQANRGKLVHACLVIVQAWIAAGRPPGPKTLGSFEEWARTVGGILQNANIPGFLDNTEQLYEAADAEGREWREFASVWWDRHRGGWVSVSELRNLALEKDLLCEALGDKSERSQLIRLGRALSSVRDRQFGSFRIEAGINVHSKAGQYRLVPVDSSNQQPAFSVRDEHATRASAGEEGESQEDQRAEEEVGGEIADPGGVSGTPPPTKPRQKHHSDAGCCGM